MEEAKEHYDSIEADIQNLGFRLDKTNQEDVRAEIQAEIDNLRAEQLVLETAYNDAQAAFNQIAKDKMAAENERLAREAEYEKQMMFDQAQADV